MPDDAGIGSEVAASNTAAMCHAVPACTPPTAANSKTNYLISIEEPSLTSISDKDGPPSHE